jgi:hypothetical protein
LRRGGPDQQWEISFLTREGRSFSGDLKVSSESLTLSANITNNGSKGYWGIMEWQVK